MTPNAQEWRRIWAMPLFEGIDREKAEAILREHGCTTCSFADGEILMSPAVHKKRIGILLKGEATVTTPDPGKETLLRFLSPDEHIPPPAQFPAPVCDTAAVHPNREA